MLWHHLDDVFACILINIIAVISLLREMINQTFSNLTFSYSTPKNVQRADNTKSLSNDVRNGGLINFNLIWHGSFISTLEVLVHIPN